MPRIDSPLHPCGHSGADTNTNTKTADSPSTTVKPSLSDDNNPSRDQHVYDHVHGTQFSSSRMPDTSDDLERNWLTATATPRFSRAGLPHVIMPVRADSRKAKDRRPTVTNSTNDETTSLSATVSRGEVVPENKTRYVAAEEASSTSASPEILMQNNRQRFTEMRHTTEDRRKSTTGTKDYVGVGKESQTPFLDSSKSAGGFTKLRRVLSLGESASGDPMSSQTHELRDDDDDIARTDLETGNGGRGDKKWQWSNIFKFLSGGTNKGLKVS